MKVITSLKKTILQIKIHKTIELEYYCMIVLHLLVVENVWKTLDRLKDVRGWQFLTMKAAEILGIVCLPPEKHIS